MIPGFSEVAASFRKELSDRQETLIVTHFYPDGDAVGSLLAFGDMLRQLDVPVVLAIDDAPSDKYAFLPGFDQIINLKKTPLDRVFPRVAVLDAGAISRIGAGDKGIGPETLILNIDHHFTGELYGLLNLVDVHASATSEILFELCSEGGLEITPQIGYGFNVSIITDTGRFRFANTTARTVDVCARLIASGVDSGWVIERVYYELPLNSVVSLAKALTNLEMHFDGQVALFGLDHTEHTDETEGFVEYAASIKDVILASFYSEMERGMFKVSLRSRCQIDVSELASRFGGGGHKKAAGFRFRGSKTALKSRLLAEFRRSIEIAGSSLNDEVSSREIPWLPSVKAVH